MSRVTYRLTKMKDPNKKGLGYKKKFPITYSLPAISRVRFQDDKGNVTVRKIRYCKNETSIFMDEQPPDAQATKVRFDNGFCVVDDVNDYLMYTFLELIDLNGTKANRDKGKKATFERVDLAKKAKESLDKATEVQEAVNKFIDLDPIQQQSIAAIWGIKTHNVSEKDADKWRWALFQEIQKDPHRFYNLLNSSDMEVLSVIVEARNTGVIEYHDHKWTFKGHKLLNVPTGLQATQELMKYLQIHSDTQKALQIASAEVRDKVKAKSSIEMEAAQFSASEMLDMGMKAKILFYDKGRGWRFTEPYVMMEETEVMGGQNRREAAISYIRENPDAKVEILHRRKEKIKKEAKLKREREAAENAESSDK